MPTARSQYIKLVNAEAGTASWLQGGPALHTQLPGRLCSVLYSKQLAMVPACCCPALQLGLFSPSQA